MTMGNKTIRIKIFGLLLTGIFIMFGFYLYFVNAAVLEAVDKKQNLRRLQELTLEYQRLEEIYFKTLSQFNLEYAYSLGFVNQSQGDIAIRQTSMARR